MSMPGPARATTFKRAGPLGRPMRWRRFGRPVWVPARLLWLPLMATGLWLLLGTDVDRTALGDDAWRMRVVLLAPPLWFADVARGVFGLLLTLLGFVAFAFFQWQPDLERSRLGAIQYGTFSIAALLFLALGALALWDVSESSVRAVEGGLDWRFRARLRDGAGNLLVTFLAVLASLGCLAASLGPRAAWRAVAGSGSRQP